MLRFLHVMQLARQGEVPYIRVTDVSTNVDKVLTCKVTQDKQCLSKDCSFLEDYS